MHSTFRTVPQGSTEQDPMEAKLVFLQVISCWLNTLTLAHLDTAGLQAPFIGLQCPCKATHETGTLPGGRFVQELHHKHARTNTWCCALCACVSLMGRSQVLNKLQPPPTLVSIWHHQSELCGETDSRAGAPVLPDLIPFPLGKIDSACKGSELSPLLTSCSCCDAGAGMDSQALACGVWSMPALLREAAVHQGPTALPLLTELTKGSAR